LAVWNFSPTGIRIVSLFELVFSQPDVLQLPEGGDFEALNDNQAQTLIEAHSLI